MAMTNEAKNICLNALGAVAVKLALFNSSDVELRRT